jgi:hypothetical protein
MAVDPADLERLKTLEGTVPDSGALLPLTSIEAVLGYIAAYARSEQLDEADSVELVVRGSGLGPAAVRHAEKVLRPLGYRAVADRLREIAGRRVKSLRPLP